MNRVLIVLLDQRHEHRILGLMLLCLHFGVWWDFGGALSRSLILAHLGLFLLWQPVWSRQEQLNPLATGVFLLATAGFVYWMDRGLLVFWMLLLTGLVGARVTVSRRDRYAYLMTLVFLVSELLIACIPPMVGIAPLANEARLLFGYGVLAVPLGLILVPGDAGEHYRPESMDFLYGLTVSLLTSILALGSLLSMYVTGAEYPVAVIQTILGIAVFILAISWLWAPLAGFSGLGQLWERYLQNVGTPMEHWLARLADLAERQQTPEQFMQSAMRQLVELPWVAGARYTGAGLDAQVGTPTAHGFKARCDDVDVAVFANRPLGTALLLHGKLLVNLVSHFYTAKKREQALTERAHLQAIYETGARVTHDIKNLLQSLYGLSNAAQMGGERAQRLLERQLPHVTQRLQMALDKLQAPGDTASAERALSRWWDALKERNAGERISFSARMQADPLIPAEFFDSVVENLLENARIKRRNEPGIDIHVELEADRSRLVLRVRDTGSPLPGEVAARLFKAPVDSRSGLGIGLYQAAKQAEQLGYALRLGREDGEGVSFELRREAG